MRRLKRSEAFLAIVLVFAMLTALLPVISFANDADSAGNVEDAGFVIDEATGEKNYLLAGAVQKDCWIAVDDAWYRADENGALLTGAQPVTQAVSLTQADGVADETLTLVYVFAEDGKLLRGAFYRPDADPFQMKYIWAGEELSGWLWLDADGNRLPGANGADASFYFDPAQCNCAARGTQTADGAIRSFDLYSFEYLHEGAHTPAATWTTVVPAGCGVVGIKAIICAEGGEYLAVKELPAQAHDRGRWIISRAATCVQEGVRELVCTKCGSALETETIPALGHKYGAWRVIKYATETATGIRQRSCVVCGFIDAQTLPALQPETTAAEPSAPPESATASPVTAAPESTTTPATTVAEPTTSPATDIPAETTTAYVPAETTTVYIPVTTDAAVTALPPEQTTAFPAAETATSALDTRTTDEAAPAESATTDARAATEPPEAHSTAVSSVVVGMVGDVNADGKINSADARIALRISARLIQPDALTAFRADVNGDKAVRSGDARIILRYAARLISAGNGNLLTCEIVRTSITENGSTVASDRLAYAADGV